MIAIRPSQALGILTVWPSPGRKSVPRHREQDQSSRDDPRLCSDTASCLAAYDHQDWLRMAPAHPSFKKAQPPSTKNGE
jgi:hypothetical protein